MRIVKDLDVDLSGRHVLVVEDIIDSGLTLNYLRKYLGVRGAALPIEVCALLVKQGAPGLPGAALHRLRVSSPPSLSWATASTWLERYRNLDAIYSYVGAEEG